MLEETGACVLLELKGFRVSEQFEDVSITQTYGKTVILGAILQLKALHESCRATTISAAMRLPPLLLRFPLLAHITLLPLLLRLGLVAIWAGLMSWTLLIGLSWRGLRSARARRVLRACRRMLCYSDMIG